MGNWWGEKITGEMEEKGAGADISAFLDYFDKPKDTYQGFEGEYLQDKIIYSGWLKGPVADAGLIKDKEVEN